MSESSAAKEYWSNTDFQRKEYGPKPPLYIRSLTRIISSLEVKSVLEIGCNAGRNLQLLKKSLTGTRLKGFDINQSSIDFGREKWGLDLELADENFLSSLQENSFDLVFTVSVLDHIPEIENVMREIKRVSGRYFLFLEPHPEETLTYLNAFKLSREISEKVETGTPYSYTHSYYPILKDLELSIIIDIPMPTYRVNWGPLYRLILCETKNNDMRVPIKNLMEEILFDASLHNYGIPKK